VRLSNLTPHPSSLYPLPHSSAASAKALMFSGLELEAMEQPEERMKPPSFPTSVIKRLQYASTSSRWREVVEPV